METLTLKKKAVPRKKKVATAVEVVEVVKPLTIIDKQNRRVLSEGKSYQMGFAFLKKVDDKTFETVQPISPCKDYLNDVIYSEHTGKDCHAFGLSYTKQNIFDGDKAYMCFKICPQFGGNTYQGMDEDIKNLNENSENVQKFLNFFEAKIGTEFVSKIEKVEDNLFMVTFPVFWCKYTYLISLFSLIIRCGQCYKGGDEMQFFTTFGKWGEVYNIKAAKPKVEMIMQGALPVQDLSKASGNTSIHNMGIVNFKF